ncbi:MAG TPA: ferritin-like domain-containing protein [Candidatus Limnocylindrales bacterium]|nr:ferritin-like domain-containing protein [Candidatus Limnocylindrales bacterium]
MNIDRPTWHRRLSVAMPEQLDLYEKTKALQWNATDAVDWSQPVRNYTEAAYAATGGRISREDFDRICAERRAFTFTQLFFGEQAALALCAQLINQCPELEARMVLAGQVIDEARHVEVFGRYLDKLGVDAPLDPMLEGIVHQLLDSDFYGEKIVGMQIFLEGIAVGLFQVFAQESPDPLLRELMRGVLRDESRHAGFGVMYLADKFERATPAERRRTEHFVGDLFRGFGMMMGAPGGGFLAGTFEDIRHRLRQIGLEVR